MIGFDLGHGETALTWVNPDKKEQPPDSLEIHKQKSQITAIARDRDGKILIGTEAVYTNDVTELDICFKKRPSADDKTQQIIMCFVRGVYQHLDTTDQIKEDNKLHFFVGCPSGWKDEEILKYHHLMSAVLPKVTVVKESRAALMQAKENGQFTVEELGKSVLVIDIGSSTTDFTLVKNADDKPIDLGIDLGASLIDKAIFQKNLELLEDREKLEEAFKKEPSVKNRFEIACRKAKELYFSSPDSFADKNSTPPGCGERYGNLYFFPTVNSPLINEIINQPLESLESKSWYGVFNDALHHVKQTLDVQGITPVALFLTGGASRMYFIPELCKKVFPNSQYRPDGQPELTIARGLARWGRVDIRTTGFKEEINHFIDNNIGGIVGRNKPQLINLLADSLSRGLINYVIKPDIKKWRSRDIITLDSLNSAIKEDSEEWVKNSPEARKFIKEATLTWMKSVLAVIENEIAPICRKYDLRSKICVNEGISIKPFSTDEWVIIIDPTLLRVIVNTVVFGLGLVISVAIFAINPIAGIISGIASFIAPNISDGIVRSMDIWQWIRNNVSDQKIDKTGEEIKPQLQYAIQNAFSEDVELESQIIRPITQLIKEHVKEQADKARILIG